MIENVYRHMPKHNFSSQLLQRLPDRVAVMELTDVLWSDWDKPERIAKTIGRIGKTPAFPLECPDRPSSLHPVPQQATGVFAPLIRRSLMTSRQSAVGDIPKKTKTLLKNSDAKPQPAQETASDSDGLRDRIAARAYAIFEERGYRQGGDLQDWLDAEREILSRRPPV